MQSAEVRLSSNQWTSFFKQEFGEAPLLHCETLDQTRQLHRDPVVIWLADLMERPPISVPVWFSCKCMQGYVLESSSPAQKIYTLCSHSQRKLTRGCTAENDFEYSPTALAVNDDSLETPAARSKTLEWKGESEQDHSFSELNPVHVWICRTLQKPCLSEGCLSELTERGGMRRNQENWHADMMPKAYY